MDNASAQRGIGKYVMAGLPARCVTIVCIAMSIKVVYKNGVFVPLGEVKAVLDGMQFTAFSDEELADIRETLGWLKAAEKSFESGTTRPMPCTMRCREWRRLDPVTKTATVRG